MNFIKLKFNQLLEPSIQVNPMIDFYLEHQSFKFSFTWISSLQKMEKKFGFPQKKSNCFKDDKQRNKGGYSIIARRYHIFWKKLKKRKAERQLKKFQL
jgi:hypothetical protein